MRLDQTFARLALIIAAAIALASMRGSAQTSPNALPQLASASDTSDAAASLIRSEPPPDPTQVSLSAPEILTVIQDRPEVVIELKTLLSETQNGAAPVQPDAITDEALYNQIATNSDFRQKITIFLRARGYVSDEDLRRAASQKQAGHSDQGQQALEELQTGAHPTGFPLADMSGLESATYPYPRTAPPATTLRDETPSPREEKEAKNITSEPSVLRRPAPYNLESLRDLYTQIPDSTAQLKRFGSEVFTNHDRALAGSMQLDVPVGPDYVIGPGDGLTIDLWGGISQVLSRVVASDGHLSLPEAGDVQVAGLTLEEAQKLLVEALRKQYRDVQASVTLTKLRTIRIYVVGDVQRPGAYEISSLSSPLSALYAAGGPTSVGSLRVLQHYRQNRLVGTVDLYDFLLRGVQKVDDRLQGGDTLVVPPAGRQVALWGAVKRQAIYELKDESTLGALLQDAGGLTVAASLTHISIERIDTHQRRETISIGSSDTDANQIAKFPLQDGDRIHVAPIAPYSERVVYLDGHVVRPGRQPYRDGMRLSDVLHSYQDLLPEPATMGEIIRLVPPDLHVQTIDFNVPDVLIGNGNLVLQPFDTIRVLGRYDADAPKVEIRGEILRPGSYPLSEGMTAAQLVRIAGGFKRDALVETADLISYRIVNGTRIESERSDVRIGDAVDRSDTTADRELKAGDVLTIHQITGWNDIGASITIEGEVAHPGSYGFQDGERLSDVLRRAGGFREGAYPAGAVLIREQVRELEEKSRVELIRQIETTSAAARLSSNIATADQSGHVQLIQQQQEQILSQLKNQPATGRLVIHIGSSIDSWAGTPADIEVRRGDVLRIPKRPGFVLVSGQVYNASAITFTPGKTAAWYLQHAGGSTSVANRKEIFVIRANGSVIGRRSGEWYDRDVLSTRLQPGDVVVVPQKIIGASLFWRNLLSTAQIASSIAITAAVAGL